MILLVPILVGRTSSNSKNLNYYGYLAVAKWTYIQAVACIKKKII